MTMADAFHENYAPSDVKPPSERSTGLVFAAVAIIAAVLWRNSPIAPWASLGIAVAFAAVSLVAPRLLTPLNIFWFRLGLLMQKVVNPVVMLAVFVVVFVPAGFIMRIWRDPLRRKRLAAGVETYWIKPQSDRADPGSMTNQF